LAISSSGGTQQINFQVPAMPDMLRNTAYVSVTQNSQVVGVYFEAPWAGYPADFFVDGDNFAMIRRKSDGSLVSPAAPARRGPRDSRRRGPPMPPLFAPYRTSCHHATGREPDAPSPWGDPHPWGA